MRVRWLSRLMVAALCAAIYGLACVGSSGAVELPDGRSYEQVTPEEKLGSEAYLPLAAEVGTTAEYEKTHQYTANALTQLTFQAAADGSGLAYIAGPTVGGNENEGLLGGNEYLATRSPDGGWSTKVLSPEGAPSAIFQAFSPNLATAVVDSTQPLSPQAPGFGEEALFGEETFGEHYDVLYSVNTTSGGEYAPLFSTKPPYRSMETFHTAYDTFIHPNVNKHGQAFLALEGASADYTHLLFAANDALTGASEGEPAAEGGEAGEFETENNLYESVDGRLRLVNVLPNGTTHAGATLGGLDSTGPSVRPLFDHAVSANGSRIFWTDMSTGHIYMREDGARTVEVSPGGTYQTATADGSTVFYTNGELFAYEVESGTTTDLTPGVSVARVLGASEDGAYVYYVTDAMELMLWHEGVTTPITSFVTMEQITAEVTPNGHSIVFTMMGEEHGFNVYQLHVYVYDADSNALYCASCTSDEIATPNAFGSILPMTNQENVYQPRWISANGAHVFFVSINGLVPQDTNELDDVYEWERPGTGSCTESTGCVYLLSGGTSADNSLFLDASENGEDVFIVTRANLAGNDEDGFYDVYDARLNAPSAPVAPVCTGTGCQGVPSAPPIFATPASVTFEGVGNFASSATKSKTKARRGKNSKPKNRHRKKHEGKRSKAKNKHGKKHKGKRSKNSRSVRGARAGIRGGRS